MNNIKKRFPYFDSDNFFVSSDFHFFHGNQSPDEKPRGIIKHQRPQFPCVKDMDDAIISNINNKVPENATMVFCGDWCWWGHKGYEERACSYRERIKCKNIFFIWGNHDKRLRNSTKFRNMWKGCYDILELNVDNQNVVFTHCAQKVWFDSRYGSINLYGHSHSHLWGGLTAEDQEKTKLIRDGIKDEKLLNLFDRIVATAMPVRQMDIGIDSHPDFTVFSWKEIVDKINQKCSLISPDNLWGTDYNENK